MASNPNAEYRAKYLSAMIEKVRADRHPSITQMNLIEQSIPPQWLPEYLDVLLEKIESENHPSVSMLKRIGMLVDRLPADQR